MGLLDTLAQRDPNYNKGQNPDKSSKGSGKKKLKDIISKSSKIWNQGKGGSGSD